MQFLQRGTCSGFSGEDTVSSNFPLMTNPENCDLGHVSFQTVIWYHTIPARIFPAFFKDYIVLRKIPHLGFYPKICGFAWCFFAAGTFPGHPDTDCGVHGGG